METSGICGIRRFRAGRLEPTVDTIITETRIELDVNEGRTRLAMLCLPQDLEALAVGFLLTEGALRRPEDLQAVESFPDEGKVVVRGNFDADALENISVRWTRGTGCGGGGTSRDVDAPDQSPLAPGPMVACSRLLELAEQFSRRADLWRRTGGVHACAVAEDQGLLLFAEDIGRHNAFDKVMGMAVLGRLCLSDKIVMTTGRLSAEIVSKAVASGVPILASRSAVTSLAVQLARRSGLTLVGFLRGRRLNVYTGQERIAVGAVGPRGMTE